MACRLFVMTGLPGQSNEDIADTLAFLRSIPPAAIHVKAFHRYPGLPMSVANSDEERLRGEKQATMMQRPPSLSTYQTLRGWLRRRIRQ